VSAFVVGILWLLAVIIFGGQHGRSAETESRKSLMVATS
jgi:hypothetical protein